MLVTVLVLASLEEVFVALPWDIKSDPKGLSQSIVLKMIWVSPRKKLLGEWTAHQTDCDMFLFSTLKGCFSG